MKRQKKHLSYLNAPSTLIIELSEADLSLNISFFCEQLIVFDQVVVQDPARVTAVFDLVLKSQI